MIQHISALARLQETSALTTFAVRYTYPDPSGKGIASGTLKVHAKDKEGAKKVFHGKMKRIKGSGSRTQIQSITNLGPKEG